MALWAEWPKDIMTSLFLCWCRIRSPRSQCHVAVPYNRVCETVAILWLYLAVHGTLKVVQYFCFSLFLWLNSSNETYTAPAHFNGDIWILTRNNCFQHDIQIDTYFWLRWLKGDVFETHGGPFLYCASRYTNQWRQITSYPSNSSDHQ
jgi:hypothetical protein